jgi:endonuclease YncB( thermonuclease family)
LQGRVPAVVAVLAALADVLSASADAVRGGRDDPPLTAHPWFEGDQEPWASQARDLVSDALDRATTITLVPGPGQDAYDRDLAHVLVDGRTLSALLVEAGLGWETVSRYGDNGLPDLAAQVLAHPRQPEFERPWVWRSTHRTGDSHVSR